MENNQAAFASLSVENSRGFLGFGQKPVDTQAEKATVDLAAQPQAELQAQLPEQQPPEMISSEARELQETKLLKQLSEMTKLLEQQTNILHAQQKVLEELVGHRKKRKSSVAKKVKNLIHKGKIIWSAL